MNHILRVNMEERDADHCEYSKNLCLWDKLFFMFLDDVSKALVALFHDDAGEIILVFDKINHSHNHWVVESPQATYFSFRCTNYLSI